MLEVVEPGALVTVQDLGRPGLGHLGVPRSGAADSFGLAMATILSGGPADAAALEVTLGGTVLVAIETCAVALGGADLGAEGDDGRPLRSGAVHLIGAGSRIRFAGSEAGSRAYLALPGGLAVDAELGSRSSYRPGGLGPFGGRPLERGDRVAAGRPGDRTSVGLGWPWPIAPHPSATPGPISVIRGPDEAALPRGTLAALCATAWTVDPASDRMGLRLAGPPLAPGDEIVSHPLVPGAIQVPPDGRPIVILADGPTIGGYPVIGVVPQADLPRLAQLGAGDGVRFAIATVDDARGRLRVQEARLRAAAELLDGEAARRARI